MSFDGYMLLFHLEVELLGHGGGEYLAEKDTVK